MAAANIAELQGIEHCNSSQIKVCAAESFHPGQMIFRSPFKNYSETTHEDSCSHTTVYSYSGSWRSSSCVCCGRSAHAYQPCRCGECFVAPRHFVVHGDRSQRDSWLQLASQYFFYLPYSGSAKFNQRRRNKGHDQRPGKRDIFLARAGSERCIRERSMVTATQLQHYRGRSGTARRAYPVTHQGLFHLPSA